LLILCRDCICSKISELLEETERLHEQVLSRQHEIKAVLSSLNLFKSTADAVSVKLMAFKENVCKHAMKPLSADVNAIKADLQLIKVTEIFLFLPTYYISREARGEMYIGHSSLCICLCDCLSVSRHIPTLLHGPGCNLGMVGGACSCALLGRFAIGARISLL